MSQITDLQKQLSQKRTDEDVQRELDAIDEQTENFKNTMNAYKMGFRVNKRPVHMYNDSEEDESDRQILLQHQKQAERKKQFIIEENRMKRKAAKQMAVFEELGAKRGESDKEDVDDNEYGQEDFNKQY